MTNPIETLKARKQETQRMNELLAITYNHLTKLLKEKYNKELVGYEQLKYMPHCYRLYSFYVYDWFSLEINIYYNTCYDSCKCVAKYDCHLYSSEWNMENKDEVRYWLDELDKQIRLCIPDKYLQEFDKQVA